MQLSRAGQNDSEENEARDTPKSEERYPPPVNSVTLKALVIPMQDRTTQHAPNTRALVRRNVLLFTASPNLATHRNRVETQKVNRITANVVVRLKSTEPELITISGKTMIAAGKEAAARGAAPGGCGGDSLPLLPITLPLLLLDYSLRSVVTVSGPPTQVGASSHASFQIVALVTIAAREGVTHAFRSITDSSLVIPLSPRIL